MVEEGVLYKTKYYVGKYEDSYPSEKNFINIRTSDAIFLIKENPDIPKGAFCYVRVDPCRQNVHEDIGYRLSPKYLSWSGSEREYLIFNDEDIKEIFWQ